MSRLSHIDENNRPAMVDVGDKPVSYRTAKATGFITLQDETIKLIDENKIKKGNVLLIAELAGVQAAKMTSTLIPLCHNIPLSKIRVEATLENNGVTVESEAKCVGQTGVEMEALTAVNGALLTIYDMCKAVDKQMEMKDIRLISKVKEAVK